MELTILNPEYATTLVPSLADTANPRVWVYRCHDEKRGWTLSAATHAPPESCMLSLGGFRIAPPARMESEGFSTEREAVALAIGMEEKVRWSRVLRIGGPLGSQQVKRMVGGKCVIAPTPDACIGQPRDTELLDFAVECFKAIEAAGGFHLTTGQDLGHGTMHDGATSSLRYLNERFAGSAAADTSVPTGEGNFQLLCGMLRALNIDIGDATVGLIGAGHVGTRVLKRLREHGAKVIVMEPWATRRAELDAMGVRTWAPDSTGGDTGGEFEFLAQPMDALVVNGSGGSLHYEAVLACCANVDMRVICGSENLVMPDPSHAELLRQAGKVYAPTELGGMMGYLTAAEEYLARAAGMPFDLESLLQTATALEQVGFHATEYVVGTGGQQSFQDALLDLYPRGD
ncbi:MAG: NAD(P)-dependent oxidoreductase [Gemmatimonas sp.]